jgi:PAS domain S-box-containing protein
MAAEEKATRLAAERDAMPDLCLMLSADDDYRILGVTDAYLRATRRRREDLLYRKLFEVFSDPPGDPDAEGVRLLRASLGRVRTTGEPDAMPVLHYPIPRPETEGGGFEQRLWEPLNIPVRGANGRVVSIIHHVDDVTAGLARDRALDRAESERSALARRLNSSLESMSDAFYLLDRDWRFVFLNAHAERLLRRSRHDLIGKVVWTEFPRAIGTVLDQGYRDAVARHEPRSFEYYYAPLEIWLDVSAYPVEDGLAVYFRDITRKRAAAEQLRLLEKAVSRLEDVVIITEAAPIDPPGPRIVFVNEAFERRTGYTAAEVIGQTPRILQGPRTQRGELARIRAALETRLPVRAELINYTRSGEAFWLETEIVPIADDTGWHTHFVAVQRDITARKREEALRASEITVLGLVAAGAPLAEVLDAIVRAVEDLSTGSLASIVLLDEDGLTLRHGAAPSLPAAFSASIDGATIGPEVGACGTAMYRGEPVITTDIETDPLWRNYRGLALAHGLHACWSSPVKSADGRVLASFALYWREQRAPTTQDHALIAHVSNLAAIAIERTRTREALRASEERFRQLAENIGEVFWMTDATGRRLLYVSPAYETIWGRSCASLHADPQGWMAAIHEEDRARMREAYQRNAIAGLNEEYRIVRPDGTVRWVRDRGFPVRGPDGSVQRVVGTARDVTDERMMEQALRESEQRFQAVASATADVIWDWDLKRGTIWWSEELAKVFGHDRETFGPGPEGWIRHIHPEDRARVTDGIYAAIARRDRLWHDEYRFLRGDGSVAHVEDRGRLILDPGGEAVRLVGGMRDVSERLEAQARIAELQERLHTLISEAMIGILVHHDFRPILANDELARILGYRDAAEILALADCRVLFAESERSRVEAYNSTRLGGGEAPGFYPVTGRRRDGSECHLENRTFRLDWGDQPAVCAMLTDVTEQRAMEDRLLKSQRLEAMGQLTGGIAHDFNNLLTIILGNAELLAESLPDAPQLRLLAEMTRTAAERGAELTSRLLSFARRQALDPKATDVNALLAGMEAMLRRTLGEHVEIQFRPGRRVAAALVDAGQLENAILNLCINARDAMPEGGRLTIATDEVHLDALPGDADTDLVPGAYVMIAVSDTGVGMTPEVLAQAFDPFFTTKDVGKGSGLGLSMVYGFVKQSRGQVRIQSEPGRGTTVRLYLPPAAAARRTEESGAALAPALRGKEKILVVEDDPLVRRHVADQLEALGYRVLGVGSGPEALHVLREAADIDLLFTDVVMPGGMNGRDLADAADRLRPGLKVLFTSGYTEDAIVHHGRLDPGVQLLQKPYRRKDLAAKIHQVLHATEDHRG